MDSNEKLNMRTSIINHRLRRLILATLLSALVAGCGSGTIGSSGGSLSGDTLTGGGIGDGGSVSAGSDSQVYLAWNKHPDPSTTGYLVLYGSAPDTATTVLTDLSIVTPGFDLQAPSVTYLAWANLGLHPGDNVCFRIRAYNPDGLSDPSPGVCTTV
jgi:hypothetical protein